jgi:hypothetical protein
METLQCIILSASFHKSGVMWVAGESSSVYHTLCFLSSVWCNVDERGSVGANVMDVMLLM